MFLWFCRQPSSQPLLTATQQAALSMLLSGLDLDLDLNLEEFACAANELTCFLKLINDEWSVAANDLCSWMTNTLQWIQKCNN